MTKAILKQGVRKLVFKGKLSFWGFTPSILYNIVVTLWFI